MLNRLLRRDDHFQCSNAKLHMFGRKFLGYAFITLLRFDAIFF